MRAGQQHYYPAGLNVQQLEQHLLERSTFGDWWKTFFAHIRYPITLLPHVVNFQQKHYLHT